MIQSNQRNSLLYSSGLFLAYESKFESKSWKYARFLFVQPPPTHPLPPLFGTLESETKLKGGMGVSYPQPRKFYRSAGQKW